MFKNLYLWRVPKRMQSSYDAASDLKDQNISIQDIL